MYTVYRFEIKSTLVDLFISTPSSDTQYELYNRIRSPARRWAGRSTVYHPLSRSGPSIGGKLILPWREDEAFRLRALANNRASSRSSRESRPELGAPARSVVFSIASRHEVSGRLRRIRGDGHRRYGETRSPHVDLSRSLRATTTEFALIYARPQIKREIESFFPPSDSAAASYTRSWAIDNGIDNRCILLSSQPAVKMRITPSILAITKCCVTSRPVDYTGTGDYLRARRRLFRARAIRKDNPSNVFKPRNRSLNSIASPITRVSFLTHKFSCLLRC